MTAVITPAPALLMIGIGGTELLVLYVVLPLACVVPAYRLAIKKGYGQLVAAVAVVISIVLAYINPFLVIAPLLFFLIAPNRAS